MVNVNSIMHPDYYVADTMLDQSFSCHFPVCNIYFGSYVMMSNSVDL